ncbi:MAG: DsbA family protein [Patescibacteria group bacterium]
MKLTSESKFFLGITAATVAVIALAVGLFSKPVQPLPRAELLPGGTPVRGHAAAPVYLIEFSDFQCPACRAVKPVIDEIVAQYAGDNFVFGYRHFPLEQHSMAMKAAIAAEAAGQQGKFWEMTDLLFANQDKLSDETIMSLAQQLNLRMEAFKKDLERSDIREKVERDKSYGIQIGIKATPTFFLNGQKLELRNFADLKSAVAEAIK